MYRCKRILLIVLIYFTICNTQTIANRFRRKKVLSGRENLDACDVQECSKPIK